MNDGEKTYRPLGEMVICRVVDRETKTPGGIHIPDSSYIRPDRGVVLSVGPGKRLDDGSRREPRVKTGDSIIFDPNTVKTVIGQSVSEGHGGRHAKGGDTIIIPESGIHAVIDE